MLALLSQPAAAQLLNRYSFDGTGTVVTDSVGGAHGTALGGAALTGTGALDFDGIGNYVELPAGLLAGLEDATFEVWFVSNGGDVWQRVFDFGDNTGGPGNQGSGLTYIVLTPRESVMDLPAGVIRGVSASSVRAHGTATAPAAMTHYALVFDGTNNEMSLYIDGIFQNTEVVTDNLTDINDENNWLGRGQFTGTAYLNGAITELRLHDGALDAATIAGSFAAGPGGSGTPVGANYCGPALPNSTGQSAVVRAEGSTAVALDDLQLVAELLPPGEFGDFLAGQTRGFFNPPGSSGFICLTGTIGRFNAISQIVQGPTGSIDVDLAAIPVSPPQAVQPGETWNFQCWYRTSGTSNFTDGLSVTFQ